MKSAYGPQHTATSLPNGKVLLLGGRLSPPQLYDPAGDSFSLAPRPTADHGAHTATVLKNGNVLVAGGLGVLGTSAAELYDPAANRWNPTGVLSQLRYQHMAALLADGRVLVAGGWSENYGPKRNTAELYDPQKGTWAPTGSLVPGSAPIDGTATTLPSGKVLLAGGESGPGASVSGGDRTAQLYDPGTGTWSPTGPMNVGRSQHTATLLPNGMVLVVGGNRTIAIRGAEPPNNITAELYDPNAGTWAPTEPMRASRFGHTATLLHDGPESRCGSNCGKVLVTGGRSLSGPTAVETPNQADLFEPAPGAERPRGESPPSERGANGDGKGPIGWLAVAVAVVAVGGGALAALRLGRRRRSAAAP